LKTRSGRAGNQNLPFLDGHYLEIHQIVPHKKIKTGFRPFLIIQVDLLVDRETLSVHVNNHKKKINSKPHIHSQNLHLDKRPLKNAPFCSIPVSGLNFNPQNTQCIPVVKIIAFLDLEQN
jgi:hypothetical protein